MEFSGVHQDCWLREDTRPVKPTLDDIPDEVDGRRQAAASDQTQSIHGSEYLSWGTESVCRDETPETAIGTLSKSDWVP